MLAELRIPNPHYPGSPARMSDGRLFTEYRSSCSLIGGEGPNFETKQRLQETGTLMISTDRSILAMRAGAIGCVDTMVPELTKRICTWNGCKTVPSHAAGIGQGRLYLPGSLELASSDPDLLAAKTVAMPGTFPTNPSLYTTVSMHPRVGTIQVPARPNRYSAPYGNQ